MWEIPTKRFLLMMAHSSSQGASLLTGVQKATFAITSNLLFSGFHAIFIINYIWAMSDRISLPIPKCTQQTRPFRSHSFNPPRTAPGSHRSRRTLSLPAREKPMIPPMIAESPESLRRSHDRYSSTEQSIQENVYEISKLTSVNQRTFWPKSWNLYQLAGRSLAKKYTLDFNDVNS